MKRTLAFIVILLSFQFIPWYVFGLMAIAYSVYWRAYELVLLGLFIDAFYGATTHIPYYTLMTGVPMLILEWLKPQLLFYTR